MHWFRVYHDIIDDPKVLQLSAEMRWYYVGILAVASRQSSRNPPGILQESSRNPPGILQESFRNPPGILPKLADIATHLRLGKAKALRVIRTLIQAGLIDQQFNGSKEDTKLYVHGWSERQFKSDDINARVRKHRAASICNVTVTPRVRERARSETETETETEGGKGIPPPWNPRQQECIDLAAQRWGASNGDCQVGDLLRVYTPELVMEAMDRHFAKVGASIRPPLLIATCRGLFNDGWTSGSNGKPETVVKSAAKKYGVIPGP